MPSRICGAYSIAIIFASTAIFVPKMTLLIED